MKIPKMTLDRLKEVFDYDPITGIFTWKIRVSNNTYPGKQAKVLANNARQPYIYICLDNERLYAHRVAWFYMTGEWPTMRIDHRNGKHGDNRWDNLRLATQRQNCANTKLRTDNTSGFKGVSLDKSRKKWVAQLGRGPNRVLGYFPTPELAYAAYLKAGKSLYGEDFFRG